MDMKFGGRGKIAAWDEEPHTKEELIHFFKLFSLQHAAPFATVIVWCKVEQVGMVSEAMTASGFHSVQTLYWYKKDQQQNMGGHLRVPAVEVGVICYLTGANLSNQYRNSIKLPTTSSSVRGSDSMTGMPKERWSTCVRSQRTCPSTSPRATCSPTAGFSWLDLEQVGTSWAS